MSPDAPTEIETMKMYRHRAEQVAERVSQQWQSDDVKSFSDALYHALVEEANLELRQILAQLGGQLELGLARAKRGDAAFDAKRIESLLGGIDRANALMAVFLDRASATKLTIRLDLEAFDLSEALQGWLEAHQLHGSVRVALQPAPIVGDRTKVLDALGHLVTKFHFAARPHEEVVIALGMQEGKVEGFIGLSPSHLKAEELMEEIRLPLDVEDVGIDVTYTRAVLERHDGSLFVATGGDHSTGFGFSLPRSTEGGQ